MNYVCWVPWDTCKVVEFSVKEEISSIITETNTNAWGSTILDIKLVGCNSDYKQITPYYYERRSFKCRCIDSGEALRRSFPCSKDYDTIYTYLRRKKKIRNRGGDRYWTSFSPSLSLKKWMEFFQFRGRISKDIKWLKKKLPN